jgi:hypothetical protein
MVKPNTQKSHTYKALLNVRSLTDGHKRRIAFVLKTNWSVAITNKELAAAKASGKMPYEDDVNTFESEIARFFSDEPWEMLKCSYVHTAEQAKEADKLIGQGRVCSTILTVSEHPV